MAARPDLDAIDGDALRGPALWQGRASFGGILSVAFPAIIAVGLMIAFPVGTLLTMGEAKTSGVRMHQVDGQWVPLDAAGNRVADLVGTLPYVGIVLLLLLAPLVPIRRYYQRRYRIDGTAVEMVADGATEEIAIADIRRAVPRWFGAWHLIRVVGRGGQRIDMLLGTRDAIYALAALRRLGVKCSDVDAVEAPAANPELALGESVRWRGRPGLASFDAARAIATIGILLPFLLLVATLAWIWGSHPDVLLGLFWTGFVFSLFGYLAIGLLFLFSERLRVWICDMFGTVLVTDRRVAWRTPFSKLIYRDLAFSDLIEAGVVERKGKRAWVTLSVRDGEEVRPMDLHGMPDADRFLMMLSPKAR
jgi:hypothetical protein